MSSRRVCYVTRGIQAVLNPSLQTLLWCMVEDMGGIPRDDLQVFRLSECGGKQKIVHTQDVPEYRKEFVFPDETPVTETVLIVDDGECLVMMPADETYVKKKNQQSNKIRTF